MTTRRLVLASVVASVLGWACVRAETPGPRQDASEAKGEVHPSPAPSDRGEPEADPDAPAADERPAEPERPSRDEDEAAQRPQTPSLQASTLPVPDVEPTRPIPDGIELLEAGAEPRTKLRLAAVPGQRQRVSLEIASSVALQLGDKEVPARTIPTMTAVLDTEVTKAPKDGPIEIRFSAVEATRVEDPEASARLVAAVDQAIAGLREAKGTWTIDRQGRTVSVDLALPEQQRGGPQPSVEGFRQALQQLWIRLPDEPVGVGARWKAVSHFDASDIEVQQVATYELVELDGDTVHVELDLEQSSTKPLGEREVGGVPMDLGGFGAVGRGEAIHRLDRIAPKRGDVSLRSIVKSSLKLGGKPQPLTTSMDFDLAVAAN